MTSTRTGTTMSDKLNRLRAIFQDMGSVLVAYSGGIDSTVVFKVAHDTLGAQATAVTAVSPTFPQIELDQARRVAEEIGGRHVIIETDQLERPAFVRNDATRCYHCKTDLYEALEKLRAELGHAEMADGTNLDDLGDDRPGIAAAREWQVRSPLVEAAMSKDEIRVLARQIGLSNWDKPAAACLSSRIVRGLPITREKLSRVELAEEALIQEGFRQFRVRDQEEWARIEVADAEVGRVLDPECRARLTRRLKGLGFRFVTLDLEGYRRGGGTGKT
jgi:uncharacterized protein